MLAREVQSKLDIVFRNLPATIEDYRLWNRKNRSTVMFVIRLDEFTTIEDVIKVLRTYFLGSAIRVVKIDEDEDKFIVHVFVEAL